jgi:tetratricopeptide (TPR) repeat protein
MAREPLPVRAAVNAPPPAFAMRWRIPFCLLLLLAWPGGRLLAATEVETLVQAALAAEQRLDSRRALELFLAAEKLRPPDAFLLQKIARQYSDLVDELGTDAERRLQAERALDYSQRAVALDPRNAVNVLSLAISHGKIGIYSGVREKVSHSRRVKDEAERALQLDPRYAWAHHVLGRWHHEVNTLGGVARTFVRILYGGLPPASADEAIRHLTQAAALEPDELAHHLELGIALAAAGQNERARVALARGLAMPSRARYDEPAKARARAVLAALK